VYRGEDQEWPREQYEINEIQKVQKDIQPELFNVENKGGTALTTR
jgi:hypothetical protein